MRSSRTLLSIPWLLAAGLASVSCIAQIGGAGGPRDDAGNPIPTADGASSTGGGDGAQDGSSPSDGASSGQDGSSSAYDGGIQPPPTFDVSLTVKEVAGVGATEFPVSVVVPTARGAFQSTSGFYLTDARGNAVPAQFEVLNRHWMLDDSIRHVVVHFQPTVGAFTGSGGTSAYRLRDNGTNPAPSRPVRVTEASGAITLDSGAVQIRVERSPFRVVTPSGSLEAVLRNRNNQEERSFDATNISIEIEERGPMRAVIRAESPSRSSNGEIRHGWAIRLYVYAGKPYVKVDYQLQNSAKNVVYSGPMYFESLALTLETGQPSSAREIRAENVDADPIDREPGMLDAGPVQSVIRHFWERWPNGLAVDANGKLEVQLFPAWSARVYEREVSPTGLYWLHDMQHVVKEVLFNFGSSTPEQQSSLARTFQFHPVAVLPVAWYNQTETTLDMGGYFPVSQRVRVDDLRKPNYRNYEEAEYSTASAQFGFANFGMDLQRKTAPSTSGSWPRTSYEFFLTQNPADYYHAEDMAMGELNAMPQWMAQYDYDADFARLGLTENPYSSHTWRKFEGQYGPPEGYLSGTGMDCKPRDDQHGWFYHVEQGYLITANPWMKDWYKFIAQFRRTRAYQKDPYPDMAPRAVGHALAHALQAYRVTGDKELFEVVGEYIRRYIGGQIDRATGGYGDGGSVFQIGYMSRAMLSYLGELRSPDPAVVEIIGNLVRWNVNHANFSYTTDLTSVAPQSDGSAFTFGDAQGWYGVRYGDRAALEHLKRYAESGIGGGGRPYVDLLRWTGDFSGQIAAPAIEYLRSH